MKASRARRKPTAHNLGGSMGRAAFAIVALCVVAAAALQTGGKHLHFVRATLCTAKACAVGGFRQRKQPVSIFKNNKAVTASAQRGCFCAQRTTALLAHGYQGHRLGERYTVPWSCIASRARIQTMQSLLLTAIVVPHAQMRRRRAAVSCCRWDRIHDCAQDLSKDSLGFDQIL